jgi:hypothetical protein
MSTTPSSSTDEFLILLSKHTPISVILSEEKWERSFRLALKQKTEPIIEYLKSKDILTDIIDGLVNEEGRTYQDGSESLNILMVPDMDAVLDCVIADHLPTLFGYLDKDKHQPRRVYFFLRLMSYLFQNRSPEMFSYINKSPEVIKKLVYHIRSPHIHQLILTMLSVERQMKEFNIPNSTWSENCQLMSRVVEILETNPEEYLDAVHKFFSELCLCYPTDSDFVKSIILVNDGALINTVLCLMDNKNTASDAVKLLDQIILSILMENKDNQEFYNLATTKLFSRKEVFYNLLSSDSLILVLAGTKLVQSFVKHKLVYLLDRGTLSCLDILVKFKLSNVLHSVVCDIICSILKSSDIDLINQLLKEGKLIDKIIDAFNSTNNSEIGYRGHLRIVANALRECQIPEVCSELKDNQRWNEFLAKLELLNETHIGYREAENRRRKREQETASVQLQTAVVTGKDGS